jgi:hypothetical protein
LYAQSIYKENSVNYPGIQETRSYHLYNKKNNPAANLKLNFFYPEVFANQKMSEILQAHFILDFFGQEYVNMTPKQAVQAYTKAYIEDYKQLFERSGMFKNEVETGVDIPSLSSLYSFEKTMRNTIFFNRGNIISQVINVYEYTGGAHGISTTQGVILDINTGKKIEYEDIFLPDTEEFISDLLLANLMIARKTTSPELLIDAGFNSTIFLPSHNLVADDKGISFIYNPYELGAYVLGIVEIFVPYSELILYMKPDSNLFRWAATHHVGNLVKFETSYLNKDYADLQFTFPSAYYDKKILNELQNLFIANAFGKDFVSYSPSDVPTVFYEHVLAEQQEDYIQKNVFSYNRNNLISYVIEIYRYDGEELGTDIAKGFVVDVKQARNLTYEDIFKPNTQRVITHLVINKLEGSDFKREKIDSLDNFFIDEEGITFIFNQRILLPYSEISDYMNADFKR